MLKPHAMQVRSSYAAAAHHLVRRGCCLQQLVVWLWRVLLSVLSECLCRVRPTVTLSFAGYAVRQRASAA